MKVKGIVPRGYCKGVVRAINIAKKHAFSNQKVSILGMIVHNQYIVDALEKINIHTIDYQGASRIELLELVDEGKVIITAHGAGEQVIEKAKEKGLEVIDATCLDVIKTHELIKSYLKEGFEILYIGKKGHPESEGALAINPQKIHLIENEKDIQQLNQQQKYIMTNQTTMSLYDVYSLCEKAKEKLKHVEIAKETCHATQVRQEAIAHLDDDIDIVFIVGDPHSNNTKKLANIASYKAHKTTYMIESVQDIDISTLKDKHFAAVSSGASTPTYLTNQVIEFLKQFDYDRLETHQKPNIEVDKILS